MVALINSDTGILLDASSSLETADLAAALLLSSLAGCWIAPFPLRQQQPEQVVSPLLRLGSPLKLQQEDERRHRSTCGERARFFWGGKKSFRICIKGHEWPVEVPLFIFWLISTVVL